MEIPDKLRYDLYKPFEKQSEAFSRFIIGVEVFFPLVEVKSQKRYSAFYYLEKPIVYIEPQTSQIKLGFFRDDISKPLEEYSSRFCDFPNWNPGHGGLVGYLVRGDDKDLRNSLAFAGALLFEVVRKRTWWK